MNKGVVPEGSTGQQGGTQMSLEGTYLSTFSRIQEPLAWKGELFGARDHWDFTLSAKHLTEIECAVDGLARRNLALAEISKADFPLPELGRELSAMDRILHSGRGFVLLTGIDVDRYSEEMLRQIFVGIGAHFGISVSQSHRGDYLGDVIDRKEAGNERPYRRGGMISMHRDPSDIVGLFCYRNAKSGGLSRVASAATVWNTFLKERPDLLPRSLMASNSTVPQPTAALLPLSPPSSCRSSLPIWTDRSIAHSFRN